MRAGASAPCECGRWNVTMIEQPRPLPRAMPIGGLPDLCHPITVDRPLPIAERRLRDIVEFECATFGRVLEHATVCPDSVQRRDEAAIVGVDLKAPSLCVHRRKLMPPIARRVRYDRMRPMIQPRISSRVPWVYIGKPEVDAIGFDEKRGNQGGLSFKIRVWCKQTARHYPLDAPTRRRSARPPNWRRRRHSRSRWRNLSCARAIDRCASQVRALRVFVRPFQTLLRNSFQL